MKLGIPWRVKGISRDTRETAWETARRARHVGDRTAPHGDPRSRNDQLFAVHERINDLTRQLERLHQAPAPRSPYAPPAQGQVACAPPSYNYNGDHHLAEAIARLERRMDELVNAGRDLPAAPVDAASVYAPSSPAALPEAPAPTSLDAWALDIDQAMADTIAQQQALDADPDAPAFLPERATAQAVAPVEPAAPAQAAPVPAQNLCGLEQHLRDITSQIEGLRPQPQGGEVPALVSQLDNSRHAGGDADTSASIERGLAEVLEALRTAFSGQNAAFSCSELAGQTAIFIAACPVPGAATAHPGP
jgi:localization factor PodJL